MNRDAELAKLIVSAQQAVLTSNKLVAEQAERIDQLVLTCQKLLASNKELSERNRDLESARLEMELGLTYFTREDTAQRLHVSERQLERWQKDGVFVPAKLNQTVLYQGLQIMAFADTFRAGRKPSITPSLPSPSRRSTGKSIIHN